MLQRLRATAVAGAGAEVDNHIPPAAVAATVGRPMEDK